MKIFLIIKRTLYVFLFLFPLFFSCTKSTSDYCASVSGPVVIRGYEVRDDMGRTLAVVGYPDNNLYYPADEAGNATVALMVSANIYFLRTKK